MKHLIKLIALISFSANGQNNCGLGFLTEYVPPTRETI